MSCPVDPVNVLVPPIILEILGVLPGKYHNILVYSGMIPGWT
jgi:hypothetical protein